MKYAQDSFKTRLFHFQEQTVPPMFVRSFALLLALGWVQSETLTVDIGDDRRAEIVFQHGDNLEAIAESFVTRYGLSAGGSSSCSTPTCAMPRAPPPPNDNPILGRAPASSVFAVDSDAPTREATDTDSTRQIASSAPNDGAHFGDRQLPAAPHEPLL